MEQTSGFFVHPDDVKSLSQCAPDIVHTSSSGYSVIYKANIGGKERAFKALKKEFRGVPLYEDLLKKEYQIGCTLNHPGIRRYDRYLFVPEWGNCIELEWIDGVPLNKLGTVDKKLGRQIVGKLCDALEYVHSKQIVHRDIKPSNILITHNGHNVKLIDFGFSDADSFTLLKTPAGTESYAAPELLAGGAVDCRADIFSLGIIIRQLLPEKRKVWHRCLKDNPSERYESVSELKTALLKRNGSAVWIAATAVAMTIAAVLYLRTNTFERSDEPVREYQSPDTLAVDSSDSVELDDLFEEATRIIQNYDGRN